eukprot:scaffold4971_cov254-Pinguiococcus_pyrenoidosus.AAC.10
MPSSSARRRRSSHSSSSVSSSLPPFAASRVSRSGRWVGRSAAAADKSARTRVARILSGLRREAVALF